MGKDQALGGVLLIGCVLGIIVYGWLVFLTEHSLIVLELTGFTAVTGVLGVLSWIGYTMVTTPMPKPLEELDAEGTEEEK